ncbi:MFS transporter [Halotalea alkalilenta]|uniref:Transporter n=1 Tax=Halotalea alkalilenta TaxID=376489 RepID=A0A172YJ70_9GAMM|nr:MFS transporter [Halotalea alkalilenta]ANF59249.1 transporter [Halotalea alkalilenta]
MKDGLFSSRPGDDGLPPAHRLPAMVSVLLATLMVVLDTTMVSVALPTMAHSLSIDSASAVWISNIYQLVAAAVILSCAALGDRIGRYRLYLGGLSLFVVSSLGCALSDSFETLVFWRAVQGLGAAAVMSIGPSLNRRIFPSRLLGAAIGMVAMSVATALAAGPTLGGLLLTIADWRWLFYINLPVGLAALVIAARFLPRESGNGRPFDLLGAMLSALALGPCVIGVDRLRADDGWSSALLWLALSAVAALAFLQRQRRTSHPLLPLSMFREPRFSLAALTSFFSFVAQTMAFVALPFLFQNAQGFSPLVSGLLFTPWPLAIMIAAPLAGRLADRVPAPRVATCGLLLFCAGVLSLALLAAEPAPQVVDVLWRSALCGLGFGAYQAPNNREMMASLPLALSNRASGVLATVRTFAQSVGAALVALALSGIIFSSHAATLPVGLALWVASLFAAVALVVSLLRMAALRVLLRG